MEIMIKKRILFYEGMFFCCGIFFASYFVFAQNNNLKNISYPILELGNCQSREDCRAFCDKLENMERCLSFAQNNNLSTIEETIKAKKIVKMKKGPGKCVTYDFCEQYCENENNTKECLLFAKKNNLMSLDELDEANKVIGYIEKGKTPKGCKTKKECEIFCDNQKNFEECFSFAKEKGLLNVDEIEKAEKALKANSDFKNNAPSSSSESNKNGAGSSYSELPVDSSYNPKSSDQILKNNQEKNNADSSLQVLPENNKSQSPKLPDGERDLFSENNNSNTDASNNSFANECMKEIYGSDVLEKIVSGSFAPPSDMKEKIDLCVQEKNPK